jgi:hypothetical protein
MVRDSYMARETDENGEHVGLQTSTSDLCVLVVSIAKYPLGIAYHRQIISAIPPSVGARMHSP